VARTPSFPAAEGVRVTWAALPDRVRRAVETRLGAPVDAAVSQPGGFSPGLASRVRTAVGEEWFLKAVSSSTNAESVVMHRREARVAAALPPSAPCARFRWMLDEDEWVVLAFEVVPGRTPALPWRAEELDRCLAALAELSAALTPSPIALEAADVFLGDSLMRWQDLARHPGDVARLAPPWRARLDDLVALEAQWPDAARGDSLLHLDFRADNLLLTPDRVYVVDWPWAAVGARWVDLVVFLPSVGMQGGPHPEEVWSDHPWRHDADDEAVDVFLAALAGMFTRQAMLPAPPGLPTLRAFQGALGRVARDWLARRRGWHDAVGS
jgi:aminoglycoside phosphotransferase (APT) family kinase protein